MMSVSAGAKYVAVSSRYAVPQAAPVQAVAETVIKLRQRLQPLIP